MGDRVKHLLEVHKARIEWLLDYTVMTLMTTLCKRKKIKTPCGQISNVSYSDVVESF